MIPRPIIFLRSLIPIIIHQSSSKLTSPTYHSSDHEVSSLSPPYVSSKFGLSCSFHSSFHEVSVHSVSFTAFTLFKLHSREVCPGFPQVKQTKPLPFPSFEISPFPLPFIPLKFFPFLFPSLSPPLPFMKFQWLNSFSFTFQCSHVHGRKSWIRRSQDVPAPEVLHQGVSHLLVSVDRGCIQTKVLLKCSQSLVHQSSYKYAIWNGNARLLFRLGLNSFPSIGVLFKSLSVELPFKYPDQKWHMSCGIWKWETLAQPTPSFETISCFILANQKSSRSCTQVGKQIVRFLENILIAAASSAGSAFVKCASTISVFEPASSAILLGASEVRERVRAPLPYENSVALR